MSAYEYHLHPLGAMKSHPPEWIVDGLIERDTNAMIFGASGTMKTFLMLDILLSVATGAPWCGREVIPGLTVLFVSEGIPGLPRRRDAWAIARDVDVTNAPVLVSVQPAALIDEESTAAVIAALRTASEEHGQLQIAAFDTLAGNFGDGSESDTRDMSTVVRNMNSIRSQFGCSVLLNHHTGWGNGDRHRGSTVLRAALDHEFRAIAEDNRVTLECTKSKDAPIGDPMAFELVTVPLGYTDDLGHAVTSAVLRAVDYSAPTQAGSLGKNERILVDALKTLYAVQERNLRAAGIEEGQVRVLETDWSCSCREVHGLDRKQYFNAKKTLLKKQIVTINNNFVHLSPVFRSDPEGPENVRQPRPSVSPHKEGLTDGTHDMTPTDETDAKLTENGRKTDAGEEVDFDIDIF